MNDIDEDIAKKHDLRTTEGKSAARDEQDKRDNKKSVGLTNPIYWLIALGIVIWWKWDEIIEFF